MRHQVSKGKLPLLLPKVKQASKVLAVLQLAVRPSRLESMLSDLSVVDSSKPLGVGTSTSVGELLSAFGGSVD
jgi:hypothetical protein